MYCIMYVQSTSTERNANGNDRSLRREKEMLEVHFASISSEHINVDKITKKKKRHRFLAFKKDFYRNIYGPVKTRVCRVVDIHCKYLITYISKQLELLRTKSIRCKNIPRT
ncbi:hypothetical protein PUN28_001380 [Cardiocondyla obscurior]|uniref:Uncharacterized protein n=1 Tax=Cardiocondyla obscurior TaxID=286306 RepID=A0AAW2H4R1_9HYME